MCALLKGNVYFNQYNWYKNTRPIDSAFIVSIKIDI